MDYVKLHIFGQQDKRTKLNDKELVSNFCAENERSKTLLESLKLFEYRRKSEQ